MTKKVLLVDRAKGKGRLLKTYGLECEACSSLEEAEVKLREAFPPFDIAIIRKNLGEEYETGYKNAGMRLARSIRSGEMGSDHQNIDICIMTQRISFHEGGKQSPEFEELLRSYEDVPDLEFISAGTESSLDDLLGYLTIKDALTTDQIGDKWAALVKNQAALKERAVIR